MDYFDLHVHPSLKPGLTEDPERFDPWSDFPFYGGGLVSGLLLKSFRPIISSQANLGMLKDTSVVSVVALIALEKAFAGNFAIQKILARPDVSPLSRRLLNDIVKDRVSYHRLLLNDLAVLVEAPRQDEMKFIRKAGELEKGKVNLLLSVEGAHSFQSLPDNATPDKIAASVLENFRRLKNDDRFRLHHLTLAHLSRQPACVHCFGVKIQLLGVVNLTRDKNFQPDPARAGLSGLGRDIIRLCHESTESPPVLVDIKHMSWVARREFYNMRVDEGLRLPIIASHIGVTGTSFAASSVSRIDRGNRPECDLVYWNRRRALRGCFFNPWTINLFDEDIIEVLQSGGLLGVSFDQRILGYQKKFYGEYMSPAEVDQLDIETSTTLYAGAGDFDAPLENEDRNEMPFLLARNPSMATFFADDGVAFHNDPADITGNDQLFDIDGMPGQQPAPDIIELTRPYDPDSTGGTHFDHLANNILHIIRVGRAAGYDGSGAKPDVTSHICAGSDLDGIIDSINFSREGSGAIDDNNWMRADKMKELALALEKSIIGCIAEDPALQDLGLDAGSLVKKFTGENGLRFIREHFA
ncbi:MAG: hypothetical protein EOO09_18365 [Chitinophagaceae bacterium]|nr:MAG: hypothetical protein EOO09_18365 [Chitinophagaceae bacterium]